MTYRSIAKWRFLVFVPLVLVLIVAVACGEDATSTPRPTATSAPTAVPATPTTAAMQPTATTAAMQPTATTAAMQPTATTAAMQPTATTAAMQPTATAKPTATPRPVPTDTATPVAMMEPVVDRVVLAVGPPIREDVLPWRTTALSLYPVMPIFETLIGIDRSTGLDLPELATSWKMSPDARLWTVTLEEGVPFQFGFGEFTAADVVHTQERLTSEDSLSSDRDIWRIITDSAEDLNVVGKYQVAFRVTSAQPDFNVRLANRQGNFFITSKRQWDEQGDAMRTQPAGTGAYRLLEYTPSLTIVHERVDNHWRHTPDFKELEIRMIREHATKLAALLAREAHLTDLPKDLHETALAAGKERVASSRTKMGWVAWWGGLYFATPDTDLDLSVPWTDVRVREALNRAIDRVVMLDTIFHGRGEMSGPYGFLPYTQGWDPSWPDRMVNDEYKYDPERSRELLAEGGYADGFEITIYNYPSSYPELEQVFEAITGYFVEIGLDAKMVTVDYATIRPDIRNRTLNGVMGWGPYISGNPHTLMSLSNTVGGGFSQYDHPFIEEKTKELGQTVDPAARDRIQREMGEHKFVNYAEMPLLLVPEEIIIDPEVIAEYILPGVSPALLTHLEFIKAVKK